MIMIGSCETVHWMQKHKSLRQLNNHIINIKVRGPFTKKVMPTMRVKEEVYSSRIIHVGHVSRSISILALKTCYKERFSICWLLLLFGVKKVKNIYTVIEKRSGLSRLTNSSASKPGRCLLETT